MRSFIILGAAALVAGSPAPAPAAINFGVVNAAPAPSLTGPLPGVASQTGVYNAAVASVSAVAAVTGVATASSSTSDNTKRELQERNLCIFGFCFGGSSSSGSTSSSSVCTTSTTKTSSVCSTSTTTKTSSVYTTSSAAGQTTSSSMTTITSAPATTSTASTSSGVVVPSTCTPISWTNTNTFTSDAACATPYEVGTYCGFINPEDPCAPQPNGYAPLTSPDTVDAFEANPVLHQLATSAVSATGYTQTFKDLNASVNANSYMGLYTLTSYDVQGCAAHCDDTTLCTGFNVYIERDPAWNPDQCSCTNPSSIANFKCTIWGSGVQAAAATNYGQSRDDFEVVIVGSNGYEKTNTTTPATPSGWTNPQNCSAVHDHPRTCIGETLFKGVFDVSLCATYATAQNAKNVKSGILSKFLSLLGYNPGKCNFFNAFMLTENGKASGTYCKLFAEQYKPSVATSIPGWSGGSYWGVESSWSFCSS